MVTKRFIPLQATEVPVIIQTIIDDLQYTWSVKYNEDNDFYSVDVQDEDGNVLYSTKLVIDNDMMHAGIQLTLTSEVVPRDLVSGEAEAVGQANLGDPVKIYVEAA
jgi:hypothetical protein